MKPRSRVIARTMAWPRVVRCLCLCAAVALATAAQGAPATGSGKFFCCTDASGKQVCGDTLPRECYGRAYRELGQSGQTVREVDAPLTAEQRAQRVAEEEQRKEEEARQKEQQRQDQALLNTYANVGDIEAMRKRALDDVDKSIKAAEARIAEIRVQRKKFENEAEFYRKKTLPPEVKKGLLDTEYAIRAQQSIIEAKRKEIGAIQAKYDEDRARFLDLQRRRGVR